MLLLRLRKVGARGRALSVAVLLAIAVPASGAWAVTVPTGFLLDFQVTDGSSTWTGTHTSLAAELSSATQGDVTTLSLMQARTVLGGNSTIESWASSFDPDPFVTNNFVVQNNSGSSQVYTVSVTSPVVPDLSVSQILQSTVILSIHDDDGVGGAAVSSAGGSSVYRGLVNGSPVLDLLDDPFANSCSSPIDCLGSGTSTDGVASQGLASVLATSIGLTITFELSPGDSAAVQSRFEVVPEPATAALLLVGAVALGLGASRRTR